MTPLLNMCAIITTIFIVLYIAVSPMNREKSTHRKNYMNKYDVQHSAIGTVTWLIYTIASIALVVYISSLGTFINSLRDRKSTRLNSSHVSISYAVFCLKK